MPVCKRVSPLAWLTIYILGGMGGGVSQDSHLCGIQPLSTTCPVQLWPNCTWPQRSWSLKVRENLPRAGQQSCSVYATIKVFIPAGKGLSAVDSWGRSTHTPEITPHPRSVHKLDKCVGSPRVNSGGIVLGLSLGPWERRSRSCLCFLQGRNFSNILSLKNPNNKEEKCTIWLLRMEEPTLETV